MHNNSVLMTDVNRFRWGQVERKVFPYIIAAPAIICLSLVVISPLIKGISLSFFSVKFAENAPFIGLKNYIRLFRSADFWHSLKITIIYSAVSVTGTFCLGLLLASLVNMQFRGRTIVRVILTLPWAVSDIAAAIIWGWMFDYQFGVLNYLLKILHVIKEPVQWLLNPHVALWSALMASIWKSFPLSMLILLAGLQAIPKEQYEAAIVDGAGRLQRFWYITLPGLRPTASILLLLSIVWSFRSFALIWALTQGGPMRATETIAIGVYKNAFNYYDMSYASALGVIGLILSLIISFFYFRLEKAEKLK